MKPQRYNEEEWQRYEAACDWLMGEIQRIGYKVIYQKQNRKELEALVDKANRRIGEDRIGAALSEDGASLEVHFWPPKHYTEEEMQSLGWVFDLYDRE